MEIDREIDRIDTKIIQVLETNGKIPNNEIAALLNISEGTVRNRIKKLVGMNLLKIKGLVNPNRIREKQFVFLLIKLAGNRDSIKVAQEVSKLPHIKSVSIITGRFDLLAEVFIEPHNLIEFLNRELSKNSAVLTVESLIVLKSFNKWI